MHKDLPQDRAIKKSYREEEDAILHLEPESVVSTTECTGLVQAEIISQPEVESYLEIYDIPLKEDGAHVRGNRHTNGDDRILH